MPERVDTLEMLATDRILVNSARGLGQVEPAGGVNAVKQRPRLIGLGLIGKQHWGALR
jgi:hypothetical protein